MPVVWNSIERKKAAEALMRRSSVHCGLGVQLLISPSPELKARGISFAIQEIAILLTHEGFCVVVCVGRQLSRSIKDSHGSA